MAAIQITGLSVKTGSALKSLCLRVVRFITHFHFSCEKKDSSLSLSV